MDRREGLFEECRKKDGRRTIWTGKQSEDAIFGDEKDFLLLALCPILCPPYTTGIWTGPPDAGVSFDHS